ncbi:MAG TPA: dihydrolipoamide acyltransferase [Gammaproteobacteria bacterium]|nr:dihydrolipoamide acyltransferase [Gammaproteobacteria bacterium]
MSVQNLKLPQFGLTMTEALIAEWAVKPGDRFAAGDLLYVAETDKIANEVLAEQAGIIHEILATQGETVAVGMPLATWQPESGDTTSHATDPPPAVENVNQELPAAGVSGAEQPEPQLTRQAPVVAPRTADGARIIATPHARKLARELGVDLHQVTGSGPKGRIRAAEVRDAAENAVAGVSTAGASTTGASVTGPDITGTAIDPSSGATRLAPGGDMRAAIARRMSESKQQIPHFYLTAHAEISELLWLHEGMKQKPELASLTLTHWFATALSMVLAEQPKFRTVYHQGEWLQLESAAIGLAVATDAGLYAPVVADLSDSSLGDNMLAINQVIDACRAGNPPDGSLSGGATTLTNLGGYPVEQVFPIINPGQSSIVGVGRTQQLFRPDAQDKPQLCRELPLVIACDHRVFNGTDAGELLQRLTELLQQPMLILAGPRRN